MAGGLRRIETDVVVVGLGAMGSQALWALARRGVDAVGVEQFEPGHARGSSHGGSRIIRTAYFEGAGYVPLVRRSWQLWRELEAESGASLLTATGIVNLAPAGTALLTGALDAARAHDLPVERIGAGEIRARWPQHLIGDDVAAVVEREGGVLAPERAIVAGVEAARRRGARTVTEATVGAVERHGEVMHVTGGGLDVRARHVVVTTGAWIGHLVPAVAASVRVIRRVVGWFAVGDPVAYASDRFPVFIRDDGDGPIWYGFPTLDGATLKLAAHTGSGSDEPADPVAGVRPPDEKDADALARLAARLRGLGTEPVRMASCMYAMTPDEHFLVGQRADLPGVTLLGGFSGHGFKFATALGEAAAELAVDGRTGAPIGPFDPHRFG
ncbi:MAG: N-methyl-L-tryptophan oxidase [Frankiaceae bacterium]